MWCHVQYPQASAKPRQTLLNLVTVTDFSKQITQYRGPIYEDFFSFILSSLSIEKTSFYSTIPSGFRFVFSSFSHPDSCHQIPIQAASSSSSQRLKRTTPLPKVPNEKSHIAVSCCNDVDWSAAPWMQSLDCEIFLTFIEGGIPQNTSTNQSSNQSIKTRDAQASLGFPDRCLRFFDPISPP